MSTRALQVLAPPLATLRQYYPGVALCGVVTLAGSFLAEHYGAPALMLVLLLGFGFASQASDPRLHPGILLCSRQLLRIGVALLGARIGIEQVLSVGSLPLLLVLFTFPLILGGSLLLGSWLGLPRLHSLVAGAAVAICGVSAAIAVAAVIPVGRLEERRLLGVVVGVTALGTLSMLLYPPLLSLLGYDAVASGLLLGATIHDVAQAAGAGYLVSDTAGDIATLTKLLRVALLIPLVVIVSILLRHRDAGATPLPLFLFGFVALFALNSLGLINPQLRNILVTASGACLLMTMAALGMRTRLDELLAQGWKPMLLLVVLSIGLLLAAMGFLLLLPKLSTLFF